MENPSIAVTYVRISQDKALDEQGVARQSEDCETLVRRRDWQVYDRYRDNDRSAKYAGTRPEFARLLKDLADGQIQVVVAWSWDRLTRNRRETVQLIEACQEHHVLISLVKGSDIDCSTAAGRLVADLLAGVARNEIDQKSERQVRAYRQAAENGKPHYVTRPYGYTRAGELIEDEALVLKQMAHHLLNGWSLHEIAAWLNDSSIPSATGTLWHRRVVRDHLTAKRNAGIRVYKGQEFAGNWTPIFDADTHTRLLADFKRRDERIERGERTPRRYLLTGFLECGQCGYPMAGHRNRDKAGKPVRDKYQCAQNMSRTSCGSLSRNAAILDHFIREAVLFRLNSPAFQEIVLRNEANAGQIEPLRGKEAALKVRLEELLDDFTDKTITKSEYQRAKQRVLDQLEAVERDITGLYSSQHARTLLSAGTKLRDRYEQESNGWRRNLIGLVVDKIVVTRGHGRQSYFIDGERFRFDPEAIEISWKV